MKPQDMDGQKVIDFMLKSIEARKQSIIANREKIYDLILEGKDDEANALVEQMMVSMAVVNYFADEIAMVETAKKLKDLLEMPKSPTVPVAEA